MKRHKFVFPNFTKNLHKQPNIELRYITTKLLLANSSLLNNSARFSLKLLLEKFSIQPSKINTYCLITGRTRFTVKNTQTSRQIFFEYCTEGYNAGFFQS